MADPLSETIARFAASLRAAGLCVTPADLLAAAQASAAIDIFARPQMQAALQATLVHRAEDIPLFTAAFAAFWGQWGGAPLPPAPGAAPAAQDPFAARLAAGGMAHAMPAAMQIAPDQAATASAEAAFRRMDIAAMGTAEIARAARIAARLRLRRRGLAQRRQRPGAGRRIDLAETLRDSLRLGGEIAQLRHTRPRRRPPGLVVLCDISGSMSRYATVLLHFLHALANAQPPAEIFLFGTRLTPVSRALRGKDVGLALAGLGGRIGDYGGGTSIAQSLAAFNRRHARHCFASPADLLLLSDGLDRPPPGGDAQAGLRQMALLGREMARLHRQARRIVWLNPLAGYEHFVPRARSLATMLAHTDIFRAGHSLDSLGGLAALLEDAQP